MGPITVNVFSITIWSRSALLMVHCVFLHCHNVVKYTRLCPTVGNEFVGSVICPEDRYS